MKDLFSNIINNEANRANTGMIEWLSKPHPEIANAWGSVGRYGQLSDSLIGRWFLESARRRKRKKERAHQYYIKNRERILARANNQAKNIKRIKRSK